jgi:hypothetical protein
MVQSQLRRFRHLDFVVNMISQLGRAAFQQAIVT